MATYEQVTYNSPDGALVGNSATEKIGFYGATPVVQPVTVAAVATTAATSTSPYGFSSTQADAIVSSLNSVIAKLKTLGLIAT